MPARVEVAIAASGLGAAADAASEIFTKLGVSTRAATAYAYENDLIDPKP